MTSRIYSFRTGNGLRSVVVAPGDVLRVNSGWVHGPSGQLWKLTMEGERVISLKIKGPSIELTTQDVAFLRHLKAALAPVELEAKEK